jgi:uncharacterized protein (TIGR00266 family)
MGAEGSKGALPEDAQQQGQGQGQGQLSQAQLPIRAEVYKATVHGSPAFAHLEVELEPGQRILSNGGSLAYMREGVGRGTLTLGGGLFTPLKRAAAGQSLLQVAYEGLPEGQGRRLVTFASQVPGDVLQLDLTPGQKAVVSRESYMAGAPSVSVGGKFNWRGVVSFGQDEGLVLPELKCEGAAGTAWLGAYGAFQRHDLEAGESLLVDNGLFLACVADGPQASQPLYTVVRLGQTLASSLLGGEGLGMKFAGPATVYTQSHNIHDLASVIAKRLPTNDKKGGFSIALGGSGSGSGRGGSGAGDDPATTPKRTPPRARGSSGAQGGSGARTRAGRNKK